MKHLNTSLENKKQKTITKHTPKFCIQCPIVLIQTFKEIVSHATMLPITCETCGWTNIIVRNTFLCSRAPSGRIEFKFEIL